MIHNIHILNFHAGPDPAVQAREALEVALIQAHRRGEHPWGEMRRDCPLCLLDK